MQLKKKMLEVAQMQFGRNPYPGHDDMKRAVLASLAYATEKEAKDNLDGGWKLLLLLYAEVRGRLCVLCARTVTICILLIQA